MKNHDMKRIWFTSDHHFGHKNVIPYSVRPFASVTEMDEHMITQWNTCVQPEDDVYHLGDIGLCAVPKLKEILKRLNGKIFLIRGNHEKSGEACAERFEWIKDYYELQVPDAEAYEGKRLIVLFHYAMRVWNASHYGSWHLYGHSHGQLPDDETSLSFDVGVDCHGFAPISYDQVKETMAGKKWKQPFSDRQ